MRARRHWSTGRIVSFLLVLAAHLLFIVLFVNMRIGTRHRTIEEQVVGILLLRESVRPNERNLSDRDQKQPQSKTANARRRATQDPGAITIAPPSPVGATPTRPSIDWWGEADEVARSTARAGDKSSAKDVGRKPKCRKRQAFEWSPEPKKFGFAGGLPYVRFGKRCVVGLGFFGCGIGKLPEANGHLLDNMHDPNVDEESVPDSNCEPETPAIPQRQVPERTGSTMTAVP